MGDKPDCGNYKGISLLATAYTILYNILISYLILHIDEITGNSNVYTFRRTKSTTDLILYASDIGEKMGV